MRGRFSSSSPPRSIAGRRGDDPDSRRRRCLSARATRPHRVPDRSRATCATPRDALLRYAQSGGGGKRKVPPSGSKRTERSEAPLIGSARAVIPQECRNRPGCSVRSSSIEVRAHGLSEPATTPTSPPIEENLHSTTCPVSRRRERPDQHDGAGRASARASCAPGGSRGRGSTLAPAATVPELGLSGRVAPAQSPAAIPARPATRSARAPAGTGVDRSRSPRRPS